MPELDNLFPTRPLQVLRTGLGQLTWVVGVVAALGFFIALLFWQVPTLLQDYRISRSYDYTKSGEILDGDCRTKAFVMTDCSIDISYRVAGARHEKTIELMYLDLGGIGDGFVTRIVHASDAPETVTIELAVNKIWNRVAMTAGLALLLLAAAGSALKYFLNGRESANALQKPVRLQPVVAKVTQHQDLKFGKNIDYSYTPEGGKPRKASCWFKKNETPLYLEDGRALAALPEGGRVAILLDEKLERVAFTEDERAAILKTLGDRGAQD